MSPDGILASKQVLGKGRKNTNSYLKAPFETPWVRVLVQVSWVRIPPGSPLEFGP